MGGRSEVRRVTARVVTRQYALSREKSSQTRFPSSCHFASDNNALCDIYLPLVRKTFSSVTMDDDSDSGMEWEEIVGVRDMSLETPGASSSMAPLEITINAPIRPPSPSEARKEKSRAAALARFVRLQSHRIHTVALLASASIRNSWLSDDLLRVRLSMSLCYVTLLNRCSRMFRLACCH